MVVKNTGRDKLKNCWSGQQPPATPAPGAHPGGAWSVPAECVKCAVTVSVFLWDFLKVRHTVTGMLEQKDGIQLPVEVIPLQKIREFLKVFFNHSKIAINMCMYF